MCPQRKWRIATPCTATRRTQDADGSRWVLHGHVISASTCGRTKGGGGWVRAAAAGVRTFPLAGHVPPSHGFRESVYVSDTSGHGVSYVHAITVKRAQRKWSRSNNNVVLPWRHCCRCCCYDVGGGGVQRKQRAPKARELERRTTLVSNNRPHLIICIAMRDQCRIKVGAIDAAALGPFKKIGPRPRTIKREKSSLFWLSFLWLVQFRENH